MTLNYKARQYDGLLDTASLSAGCLKIVEVYDTACLAEHSGNFITLLAGSRSGLPGSVNVCIESFKGRCRNDSKIRLDFNGGKKWESGIKNFKKPLSLDFPETILTDITGNNNIFSGGLNDLPELLGKGAGLTPAGDDFIAGALNAAAAFSSELFNRAKDSVKPELSRTTALSCYYLSFALEKRAGQDMLGLLNAVSENCPEKIENYGRKILSYGASSGLYMIKGILWALKKI